MSGTKQEQTGKLDRSNNTPSSQVSLGLDRSVPCRKSGHNLFSSPPARIIMPKSPPPPSITSNGIGRTWKVPSLPTERISSSRASPLLVTTACCNIGRTRRCASSHFMTLRLWSGREENEMRRAREGTCFDISLVTQYDQSHTGSHSRTSFRDRALRKRPNKNRSDQIFRSMESEAPGLLR